VVAVVYGGGAGISGGHGIGGESGAFFDRVGAPGSGRKHADAGPECVGVSVLGTPLTEVEAVRVKRPASVQVALGELNFWRERVETAFGRLRLWEGRWPAKHGGRSIGELGAAPVLSWGTRRGDSWGKEGARAA
jgi:hypothetical protein